MPAPTVKISPDHRIDLPKEVQEEFNWAPGQELMVIRRGHGIYLRPTITRETLRGLCPGASSEGYREIVDRG